MNTCNIYTGSVYFFHGRHPPVHFLLPKSYHRLHNRSARGCMHVHRCPLASLRPNTDTNSCSASNTLCEDIHSSVLYKRCPTPFLHLPVLSLQTTAYACVSFFFFHFEIFFVTERTTTPMPGVLLLRRRFESPVTSPCSRWCLVTRTYVHVSRKTLDQFDEGAKCGPDSARAKGLMRGAYKMMEEYVHVDR